MKIWKCIRRQLSLADKSNTVERKSCYVDASHVVYRSHWSVMTRCVASREQRVWPGNDQCRGQVTWHPAPSWHQLQEHIRTPSPSYPAPATPLQPFRGGMRPSSRSGDTVSGAGEAMLIFTINAINQVHKLTCCQQQDCTRMSLGLCPNLRPEPQADEK